MKYIFTICLLLLLSLNVFAEVETLEEEKKCTMGENDSRNDVRQSCFLSAKRALLEKAGSYLEVTTEIINYKISRDDLISYSAELLKNEGSPQQATGYQSPKGTTPQNKSNWRCWLCSFV